MNNRLSLILETVQIIVEQGKRKLLRGRKARARVSRKDPSVVALPPGELAKQKRLEKAAAIYRAGQKAARRAPISADNPPTENPPVVGGLLGQRFDKGGKRLPVAVGQVDDEGINQARLSGTTVVGMLGPAGGVRHESQEEIAAGNLKPNTKKTGEDAKKAIRRARISDTARPSETVPIEVRLPGGSGIPQISVGRLISGQADNPRTRFREGGGPKGPTRRQREETAQRRADRGMPTRRKPVKPEESEEKES